MEQFMKQLRDNWIILIFIGSLIMSWTTISSRLTEAESDIKDLKVLANDVSSMKIELGKISTSVEFIKQQVK